LIIPTVVQIAIFNAEKILMKSSAKYMALQMHWEAHSQHIQLLNFNGNYRNFRPSALHNTDGVK